MLKLGLLDVNTTSVNKAYLGSDIVFNGVFVSLWRTTTPNETITLPTPTNYTVNWGDGTVTTDANSHVYAIDGDYEIKISGNITDFAFFNTGDKDKILEVSNFGGASFGVSSFYGCSNLDVIDLKGINTNSGSIGSLFRNCTSLVYNSSINLINVENSTGINSMFRGCTLFNQPLTFDASNATLAQDFLRDATTFNSLVDINLSSATLMNGFFANCINYNQDINLNTPNVTNFSLFLFGCSSFNSELNIETSSVNNLSGFLFNASLFNKSLILSTSNCTSMATMFRGASSFNQDISNFNTSNVISMSQMFLGATAFNQNISSWSFVSVTDMSNFMLLKTENDYDANYLSDLLIKLDQDLVFANMVNVNLGFGTIKYDATGVTAYNSLINKGFIIQSGGQL